MSTGSDVATCTSETMIGDGASVVISHPAPVSCIHEPTLDSSVAVQRSTKLRWRNARHTDAPDVLPGMGDVASAMPGISAARCDEVLWSRSTLSA